MLYFFILLFFILSLTESLTDFEKIDQAYECDPECWFREDEINSTTISKWPVNCTDVCGKMLFYQSADIPVFDLLEYFKNLRVFKGGISLSTTQYASVEFLSSLEEVYCDLFYFEFSFNRNLEVLNFGNLTNVTCNFYAYNNTILDATSFCEQYEDLTIMFIYDNFKNCKGCIADTIYTSNMDKFQGCTSVINVMYFANFIHDWNPEYAPALDLSPFKDIQNISGCLDFYRTDLKNFSFFENLEYIRSNQYREVDISIYQCFNLTRFDMPSLKRISTTRESFLINVDQVHDDFCFTTSEMSFFLENNVKFAKLDAKFCQNDTLDSVCIFNRMSDLETNCSEILGDVLVGSGDEIYMDKLKSVKNVYGSIRIEDTSFTDLSFLGNLEYVALLNASSIPFQVYSNKELRDATLPNLKRVFSKSKYQMSFTNNSNSLLNSTACLGFMENLFDTNVAFDGKECEAIDREIKSNYCHERSWIISITFIFLLFSF